MVFYPAVYTGSGIFHCSDLFDLGGNHSGSCVAFLQSGKCGRTVADSAVDKREKQKTGVMQFSNLKEYGLI